MVAQPNPSWLGELSPSCLCVFGVPENRNGPLALALAMGEVPPSKQDHRLDHKTILASPWRAKMPNKKKHQQLPLPISA
jgi:hypothetical protein